MYTDIEKLREFYRSSLGEAARRVIRRRLRELWPKTAGMTVVGVGYATPFLRPFLGEAERVVAVMPASQGVAYWPGEGPGLVTLADEAELPLADLSVDRILLIHGLEGTEQLRPMLREIWRVMAGNGCLIAVVPNRRGLWARAESTPFGHGYPYSVGQLKQVLRDTLFVPERTSHALFIPPINSRFSAAWAPAWEQIGIRWFKAFAGVTMIEASKQIFAGLPQGVGAKTARSLILPVLDGAGRYRRSSGEER
ncbi:MAG: methyltransferase domain-containing protein [Rhodospirillaceae bacterium]